eukprot:488012-Alexandrium_andersonii.AAC.1
MHQWLEHGEMRQMVCVVKGVESGNTLERWVFDVEREVDSDENSGANTPRSTSDKSEVEIRKEIGAIIRQITAS